MRHHAFVAKKKQILQKYTYKLFKTYNSVLVKGVLLLKIMIHDGLMVNNIRCESNNQGSIPALTILVNVDLT